MQIYCLSLGSKEFVYLDIYLSSFSISSNGTS